MVKFEIKLYGYPLPPGPMFHMVIPMWLSIVFIVILYKCIVCIMHKFIQPPSPNAPFLLRLKLITPPPLAMYEAWVIVFSPYHQGQVTIVTELRFVTTVATGGHVKFVPAVYFSFQKTTRFLAKFTKQYKIYTQQV